jgi:hypothetical protein
VDAPGGSAQTVSSNCHSKQTAMTFLTNYRVTLSRSALFVIICLTIPYLIIARIFEIAGGGTGHLEFLIYPLLICLLFFTYIAYRRWQDQKLTKSSPKWLIYTDILAAGVTISITALTVYAMISHYFEIVIFFIQLIVLLIATICFMDDLRELKSRRSDMATTTNSAQSRQADGGSIS